MNKRILFNDNWEFFKASIGEEYSVDFNWQKVDIPHDWLIYDTNNLYETSTGWYRKKFTYNETQFFLLKQIENCDDDFEKEKYLINDTL